MSEEISRELFDPLLRTRRMRERGPARFPPFQLAFVSFLEAVRDVFQ